MKTSVTLLSPRNFILCILCLWDGGGGTLLNSSSSGGHESLSEPSSQVIPAREEQRHGQGDLANVWVFTPEPQMSRGAVHECEVTPSMEVAAGAGTPCFARSWTVSLLLSLVLYPYISPSRLPFFSFLSFFFFCSLSEVVPLFPSILGKWQMFTTQLKRHQNKPCVCSLDNIQ